MTSQKQKKKTFQNILFAMALLVAVIILFYLYTETNNKRIEEQNRNYARDSAWQMMDHVEDEFANARNRINTYAYFFGESLAGPEVSAEALDAMAENSLFDAFCFTDREGYTLTADGKVIDSRDREYYSAGMQGESGVFAVHKSRLNGEATVSFYTPLYYNGEVLGVFHGIYSAREYLRDILDITFFGQSAEVYLCTQDGTVLATSDGEPYVGDPLADLYSAKVIDEKMWEEAANVFRTAGECTFACTPNDRSDNVCVIRPEGSEFILLQIFPKSVTQNMIENANRAGMILEAALAVAFIIYIIILMIRAQREKRQLSRENQEMGYVIGGVMTLFSRFIMVDFEKDSYQYLAGTGPEREGFPRQGSYETFSKYLCSFMAEPGQREELEARLKKEALCAELGRDGIDLRYEYKVLRNGQAGWEHMNVICLERTGTGEVSKLLVIRQNVTELKERELRIQAEIAVANRKERQYRIAIMANSICTYEFNLTRDLIGEDIIRIMPDGAQVSLLEAVGLTAPCRASEWFSRWAQFLDEDSKKAYRDGANVEQLKRRYEQGEAEVDIEYWNVDFQAERRCVRQSFIMTREDETGDVMVMVVTKDITEQTRRQQEQTEALKEALLQAQHANNAKTTFLANMSHDIRTPMNAIIGFTTIAATHIDNQERVRDSLQKVLASSNHLLSLINDILDMSRIESGKVQIVEQECNISEIMHNLVNIIQPQVKAKQLSLFIDTFDVTNEDVVADAVKLNQVFVNLMSNAVKYTPAGGTISLRIKQKSSFHRGYGEYAFILTDTGIGMTPDFIKHIFEPFEREESTTRSGIQGTGLGMAITKNIVDMMGGTISIESEKGKGSTFTVELSLKLQDKEGKGAEIKELEGLRALVVDDDCDACASVNEMLQQIGMHSEWTTSGHEAVYRAKLAHENGNSYHTFIIDWQMVEISGIETTRKIRKAVGNDVPIIILTAYDWSDIEEEAREAGVTAFCAKPLFMSDLKNVLLAANHLVEHEEKPAEWTKSDFGGKRILLVEDNELNREIAQTILEETGFVVESAPDGTDAVDMMRRSEEGYYDAILMDVQMPVMNGYEATRTIRALPRKDAKTIPIIAMTANAMEDDKETALKSGMNAHLAKPIDVDKFITVLHQFLS